MMSYIYVRTKPGRVARVSPSGRFIPHDTYASVEHTPYIDRLLNVHGDIEKKPEVSTPVKAAASEPASEDAKPSTPVAKK